MSSKILDNKTEYNEKTKIWSGIKTPALYGPECSIGEVALQALLKDPEHIAQICYPSGRQYTNREIATFSIRVAQYLQKLQLQQCEDIVGICATNSDFLAALFFGALLCGLTVSTLDPSFDKAAIKHILSITKPKVMFCDGAAYDTVRAAIEESELPCAIYTIKDHKQGMPALTEFLEETGLEATFKAEPLKLGYLQTAAILCSSGTTGAPKGVCMSHASLMNGSVFQLDREDRLLCFSTPFWFSGLISLINGTHQGATRVISARDFSADDLFDIVDKHKVTIVFTAPSQVAVSVAAPSLKNYYLPSVTDYLLAGAAMPFALVERLQPHMPNAVFKSGYGCSEFQDAIALGPVLESGSAGAVATNCEVKIVADDDEEDKDGGGGSGGKLLGPGQIGEICARRDFHWAGYYGNPATTEDIYDADGWLRTGDLGYVHQNGDVFIVGRKKEIFKSLGYQIFPTELEHVIAELPGVAEVCVCGIPDNVAIHLPAAAVVRRAGSSLSEEEVYQHVAERLTPYKHLKGGVYFLEKMPKTVSGKNLRRKILDICVDLRRAKEGASEQISENQSGIVV